MSEPLRTNIAKIINGVAFRPCYVNGDDLSETEKEKWLRARNVALYKADQIMDAIQSTLAESD